MRNRSENPQKLPADRSNRARTIHTRLAKDLGLENPVITTLGITHHDVTPITLDPLDPLFDPYSASRTITHIGTFPQTGLDGPRPNTIYTVEGVLANPAGNPSIKIARSGDMQDLSIDLKNVPLATGLELGSNNRTVGGIIYVFDKDRRGVYNAHLVGKDIYVREVPLVVDEVIQTGRNEEPDTLELHLNWGE